MTRRTEQVHPYDQIRFLRLVTLTEWGALEDLDHASYRKFRFALDQVRSAERMLCLYRGESKGNLRKQLFGNQDLDLPDNILYLRLFYFGEKARHFSQDDDEAIARRTWLRSIGDAEPSTFEWIFDRIHRIVGYKYKRVRHFCSLNPKFALYFGDPSNKRHFIACVGRAGQMDRALIRDYYLYFLHTFGRRGIHSESFLISASRSLKVATRFRDKRDENVVLYLFTPPPKRRYAVSSHIARLNYRVVSKAGLPGYSRGTGLYAEQEEVALRGAIFPQLILGVSDRARDRFVVNPHLLRMSEQTIARIDRRGIEIDQRDLELLIHQTGFHRYVELSRAGEYQPRYSMA